MVINKDFADVKHRILEINGPTIEKMHNENHHAENDDQKHDPEAQNLLANHAHLKSQEDNLVQCRKLGHESLQVGNELK